jgi:NADPH:quinone reductase-like Zn-dependent oxidoreductase
MAIGQLPKTMRALVHNQALRALSLSHSYPVPTTSQNEHLIKVDAVALTNGELLWPRPPELNESHPGVEMAGQVVTAPPASKFPAGTNIYMRTTFPRAGSAREYSIGLETEIARRPGNISPEQAACVPVSALTAWQALFVHGGCSPRFDRPSHPSPEARKKVLVNGASGGVGLWMTQLAHAAGLWVTGTSNARNEVLVREFGANEIIDYTKTSISEWISNNPESKFDLVLDCVGGDSLTQVWRAAGENGLVLSIAPPKDMVWKFTLDRPESVSGTVQGRFFIMEPNGEHLQQITELIEAGKARAVVDSVFRLEEYQMAFDRVGSGRTTGKVVIQVRE